MTSIKVMTAAVAAFVCLQAGLAQETFNLVPLGGATATQPAAASDTVKVQGRGVGIDEVSALKDAYRDAIERAVGLYVDAEQIAQNDQLVKDQVLTQSNAYITDYKKLSSERIAGGLVQLRIVATVKKQALAKKVRDVMQPQVFALGNDAQNLHSQITTVAKRGEDGAALLKNVLDGVDPVKQLIHLTLADSKFLRKKLQVDSSSSGELTLFRFKFEVDEQKYYNDFLPPLLKVLDQIALEQPKEFRMRRSDGRDNSRSRYDIERHLKQSRTYLDGVFSIDDANDHIRIDLERSPNKIELGPSEIAEYEKVGFIPYLLSHGSYLDDCGIYCGVSSLASSSNNEPWSLNQCLMRPCNFDDSNYRRQREKVTERGFFQMTLITKMNKEQTNIMARSYKLPVDCFDILWNWYKKFGNDRSDSATNYNIVFSDGTDEESAVFPISIENYRILNVFMGSRINGMRTVFPDYPDNSFDSYGLYITPMIGTTAQSFQTWIPFDIPQEQLTHFRSVKIELQNDGTQSSKTQGASPKMQGEECATLLKSTLSGIDPVKQLLRFSLADSKLIRKKWGDKGERYLYRFKFEVDENKYYHDFLPRILNVLEKIAFEPPKSFYLQRCKGSDYHYMTPIDGKGLAYFCGDFQVYGEGRIDDNYLSTVGEKIPKGKLAPQVGLDPYCLSDSDFIGVYCDVCTLGAGRDKTPWSHRYASDHLDFLDNAKRRAQECGFFLVTVITKMNKYRTSVLAKSYKLPPECLDVMADWYKKIGDRDEHYKDVTTDYVISFLGDGGEEVAAYPVSFKNSDIINVYIGKSNASRAWNCSIFQDYPDDSSLLGMYVTPMIKTTARTFETWIPFDIPQEQLPKIRSVKIELAN